MKFRIYKKHLPFSIAYVLTLLFLLLSQIGELPMEDTLRKIKYPYILFVFILVLMGSRIKRGTKAALLVMLLLIAHDLLFGFVFINSIVAFQINDNATQMLWFLLFVLVTYLYVSQNNFFKGFVTLSFWTCGAQLIVAMLRHRDNIVNPVWALVHSFTSTFRYKNEFGFTHAGYTANACYLTLALSLFFFEIYRNTDEFKKLWFWASFLVIDAVAGMELLASTERSGIISTFIVFAVYVVFVLLRIRIERKTFWACVGLAILAVIALVATGVFADIWSKSNRELNITINYPLFKAYGSTWTGLGFIESAGFVKDRHLFPMETSSLDMYYVYIYFSTGLLGALMVGTVLITILIKLLINKKTNMNILALGFYASLLFFAFWQCNMFTHRYVSSYVISTVLLCVMSEDCCLREKPCTNIKSTE